jgi:hypothetical protein
MTRNRQIHRNLAQFSCTLLCQPGACTRTQPGFRSSSSPVSARWSTRRRATSSSASWPNSHSAASTVVSESAVPVRACHRADCDRALRRRPQSGIVHDAANLAHEVHSRRDSAPTPARRVARDPRMRIQACGLAVRLYGKLEQSLRAMAAEESVGRFGAGAGSDMISFICCSGMRESRAGALPSALSLRASLMLQRCVMLMLLRREPARTRPCDAASCIDSRVHREQAVRKGTRSGLSM